MQAGRDAYTVQRALLLEALTDQAQYRHLLLGPHDPVPALIGQVEVLYVVTLYHRSLLLLRVTTRRCLVTLPRHRLGERLNLR